MARLVDPETMIALFTEVSDMGPDAVGYVIECLREPHPDPRRRLAGKGLVVYNEVIDRLATLTQTRLGGSFDEATLELLRKGLHTARVARFLAGVALHYTHQAQCLVEDLLLGTWTEQELLRRVMLLTGDAARQAHALVERVRRELEPMLLGSEKGVLVRLNGLIETRITAGGLVEAAPVGPSPQETLGEITDLLFPDSIERPDNPPTPAQLLDGVRRLQELAETYRRVFTGLGLEDDYELVRVVEEGAVLIKGDQVRDIGAALLLDRDEVVLGGELRNSVAEQIVADAEGARLVIELHTIMENPVGEAEPDSMRIAVADRQAAFTALQHIAASLDMDEQFDKEEYDAIAERAELTAKSFCDVAASLGYDDQYNLMQWDLILARVTELEHDINAANQEISDHDAVENRFETYAELTLQVAERLVEATDDLDEIIPMVVALDNRLRAAFVKGKTTTNLMQNARANAGL